MFFVFYKLKAEDNIEDILNIARELDLNVIFIPREDSTVNFDKFRDKYSFKIMNYEDFIDAFKDKKIAFIETYGTKYISEVNLRDFDAFVFGSEDYGIDICDIKKAYNYEVLRIPIKSESYKVVSSFVMVLTELKLQETINKWK